MKSVRRVWVLALLCTATALFGQQLPQWRWPLTGSFRFEAGPWGSWTAFAGGRGSTWREPASGSVALRLRADTEGFASGVLPRQDEVIAVYQDKELWSVYRYADTADADLVDLSRFWHLFWHPTADVVYRPRAVLPPLEDPPFRPRFSVDVTAGDRQTLQVQIVMETGVPADRLPSRVAVFLDETKVAERHFVTYGAWLDRLRAGQAVPIALLELPAATRAITVWSYDFDGRSFREPIVLPAPLLDTQ